MESITLDESGQHLSSTTTGMSMVFGKAIHSLSRIGEELYIEPLEHGLALRTVNSSRSAYACFVFSPTFFLHYNDGSQVQVQRDSEEDEVLKCKISMKSCLSIFKSLSTLERTVDKCKIQMNMDDARLIFQMCCRHGIVKTYNLAFIECETLQAVFSKDLTPNVLTAQTRLFSEAVMNFQNNQEEVSLIVNPEHVCFKNYTEDEPDASKVVHTQMTLMPDEFDSYQVGVDTEVTFCLKELRAILGFSESANLPVSIHFESPGKPIIFCLESDPSFEGSFVLATLADPSNSQVSCSQQSTQVPRSTRAPRSTQALRGTQKVNQTSSINNSDIRSFTAKRRMSSREDEPSSKRHEMDNLTNQHISNIDTPAVDRITGRSSGLSSRSRVSKNAKLQAALNDLMNDSDPEIPVLAVNPGVSRGNTDHRADSDSQESLTIAVQDHKTPSVPDVSGYLEADDDDAVPDTPPRRSQFKSVFFGLSQTSSAAGTQNPGVSGGDPLMVLAEDTDEDD